MHPASVLRELGGRAPARDSAETSRGLAVVKLVWVPVMISRKGNSDFVLPITE